MTNGIFPRFFFKRQKNSGSFFSHALIGAPLCLALTLFCTSSTFAESQAEATPDKESEALFKQRCASCHESGTTQAPSRAALYFMYPGKIYRVLTTGVMQPMAAGLSDAQIRGLVELLTFRKLDAASMPEEREPLACKPESRWFDYNAHPGASGWGMVNPDNKRYIPKNVAGLSASDVSKLKLKWSFALPDTDTARAQPAVAGGAVYIGGQGGDVYALDAKSGCMRWHFKGNAHVRTAISISDWQKPPAQGEQGPLIYYGDAKAMVYALDAVTGKQVWSHKAEDQIFARITGAPTLYTDKRGPRLYVPVSSIETAEPNYGCCVFRGSVSALDARNGKLIWKSYSIPTEPTAQGKNANGVVQYGPSGAGVWNSPTIDPKRNLLYIGTGENLSTPAEGHGGAVLAMDLDTGKIRWAMQPYGSEAYNSACHLPGADGSNCPKEFKSRYGIDIAASPVLLRDAKQKDMLVAGQKTGDIYGIDPDNGHILWRRRISSADFNWGVLFGMSAEGSTLFAGVVDVNKTADKEDYWGKEELGLYALNGFTGDPVWRAPLQQHCHRKPGCRGYSAALTTIPGVVFAGARDGYLRAFNTGNGKLLWEFDTNKTFTAVNGENARGGSMDGPGPVIVNGMLYVNSGYAAGSSAAQPGNAFLAFSVDGR